MNLRDEIINIIEDNLQGSEVGIDGQEEATDEILKLIEKRIDKMISEIPKDRYPSDTGGDGYFDGQEYILEEIKEMLK